MANTARRLFYALPRLLQRDIIRGSDAAIAAALRDAGDPKGRIGNALGDELSRFAGAIAIGIEAPWVERKPSPLLAAPYDNFGLGDPNASGGRGMAGHRPRTVRRIPFSLYDQTLMSSSLGAVVGANLQNYQNFTQWDFVVTHVGMAELTASTFAASTVPKYLINIAPVSSGKTWMNNLPTPPQGFLTNMISGGSADGTLPSTASSGLLLTRWEFSESFLYTKNATIYADVSNDSGNSMDVELALVAFKRDNWGSPRIFSSYLSSTNSPSNPVAANSANTGFSASALQNDGDYDADMTEMLVSAGSAGDWGAANVGSPRLIVRPENGSIGLGWTGLTTEGALAICLNNTPGGLGAYWRLAKPQVIPPGTGINLNIQSNGTANWAAVSFTGYLNVEG